MYFFSRHDWLTVRTFVNIIDGRSLFSKLAGACSVQKSVDNRFLDSQHNFLSRNTTPDFQEALKSPCFCNSQNLALPKCFMRGVH